MTQYEFDNVMNAIKREYEEQAKPLRKQLEALNEEYMARKEALKKAFPNIKGVRKPDGYNSRRDYHQLRRQMVQRLKENLKDLPNINTDDIKVSFRIDGDSVVFDTIIPKK